MKVTAAVTTFNRLESLKRGIATIRAQTRRPDEIIVVDDVSSDGTGAWLDQQPDIVAIHQPENGGCATSFHTVLKAAYDRGADYVWAMDDDVYAEPDALQVMLEAEADLRRQGIKVGGLTAYQTHWDDGGTTWLPFRLPSTVARALRYRYLSPEIGIRRGEGGPEEIDLYAFIGTLFTREAMAEVGFPRPDFYYYGEDTDYALRLAEHGYRSFVVPKSIVEHAGGGFAAPALFPVKANWRLYYMYRNQLALVRMYRRRLGAGKALACGARILGGAGKRLMMEAGRGNFAGCRLTLLGLGHGLSGRMGRVVAPGA
ncbi:MAG TPA: glycosyltransferase [Geminicoccaceae bacterium]